MGSANMFRPDFKTVIASLAPFARDRHGNVAVFFGFTLVPIAMFIAVALDYQRALTRKSELQAAVDSAALAAALGYTGGSLSSSAQSAATARIQAQVNDPNVQITFPTPSDSNSVCILASSTLPDILPTYFSQKFLTASATSCAAPKSGFEVALVLDNTGSMAESAGGVSKMQALVTAATQLVNILNPNPSSPNAAIAVVPFSSAVNVGTQYANASWIDTQGQSSIHWQNYTTITQGSFKPTSRFSLFSGMNTSWGGCVEERPSPYLTADAAASSSTPDTLFAPFLAPDEAGQNSGQANYNFTPSSSYPASTYYGSYISYNSYLNDNGGVCQSGDIYSQNDAADPISHGGGASKICKYSGQSPSYASTGISGVNGGSGTFPSGPNFGCYTAAVQPLTTDMTKITGSNGILSKMTSNGDTNLIAGLMWGWRTISPNGPFVTTSSATIGQQNPMSYTSVNNKKIIVFMTDGFNHWASNPYSPYKSIYNALGYYANNRLSHYSDQFNSTTSTNIATTSTNYRNQMDNAVLEACTNAKKAGVIIYTIGFSVSSNPIDQQGQNLLNYCASSSSNFYMASDSTGIQTTFQKIANSIQQLHLTQ